MTKNGHMTNREAAQTDSTFLKACEIAGVEPSRQKYRKFKFRRGTVYDAWMRQLDKSRTNGIQNRQEVT